MIDLCLYLNVKKLERQLSTILENEFKVINLHPTYAYIIKVVACDGQTKVKNISKHLGLESCTVTRMVNKLECEGYLKKGSDISPCHISLTKKGYETLPKIEQVWSDFSLILDEKLSESGKKHLNEEIILTLLKLKEKKN